jgi:hypothetical protein
MARRHGCLRAYLLYIVLSILYFIVIGKLITRFFPYLQSDIGLELALGSAVFLSILTVLIASFKRSIWKFFRLPESSSDESQVE